MATSYYRDLIQALQAAGCRFVRTAKGDHEIWYSPISQRYVTVDRNCRNRHTANAILKQAGLPKKF